MHTVAIHQPVYLPWAGFFHKVTHCDTLVLLDLVDYSRGDFINRNRILLNGNEQWLTVPVRGTGRICDLSIDGKQAFKNLKTLELAYGKAPYGDQMLEIVRRTHTNTQETLGKFNTEVIRGFLHALGIRSRVILASDLLERWGGKNDLIRICHDLRATHYISGNGAKEYMKQMPWAEEGIKVVWQDFVTWPYTQYRAPAYHPRLSIVDVVANCGLSETAKMLQA